MKTICLLLVTACVFAHGAIEDVQVNAEHSEKSISPLHFEFKTVNEEARDIERISSKPESRLISDVIANLLEGFRDIVINGNDKIPVLDPFELDQYGPLEFTATGMRITANVYKVRADGLRWYVVDRVEFNALRLSFSIHLTLPYLNINGAYDATAQVALVIQHNSGGNFKAYLNRFELGVDLRLGTNIFGGGHLTLREFKIDIDIADLTIRVEGLTGSSILNNIINNVVQSVTQDIIQNQLEDISNNLTEQLFDVISDFLKDFTLQDILG